MRQKEFKVGQDEECLNNCICTHCKQLQCEEACSFCISQGHPCPLDRCSYHKDEEV